MSADAGEQEPGQEQSFLSHLIELRQRLVRSAIATIVIFLALSPFMKEIFAASIELAAYLVISASRTPMTSMRSWLRVKGA